MSNATLKPSDCGRAWAEIDLGALAHNVSQLRAILPDGCKLMAVVKADAYGHGAKRVAEVLRQEGVDAFAVATAAEGAIIRECIPDAEILVLGYTPQSEAKSLKANRLAQLVVDSAHAKALDTAEYGLPIHIAIDTGMHRLGIGHLNIPEIESIFACENLIIKGLATHLAVSDSLSPDDTAFSALQIMRFHEAVGRLREKGHDTGKLHAQASYGAYNLPDLHFDYARIGIGLYGVMSHDSGTVLSPRLRPVLSLRATVAQVRWVDAGESVSYGRLYVTDRPTRLATVSIGYADGVPRQMSGNGGLCIVKGCKAPIVGRICMDLLMADVTEIDDVSPGDVVTIIGRDGDEEIRCEDVAAASGTITNDILCRLGNRLPRIYIKDER